MSETASANVDENDTKRSRPGTPTEAGPAAGGSRRGTEITRFRVFSRVRPFIEEELRDMKDPRQMRSIVEMIGNRTVLLDPREDWAPRSQYEFDASLWSIPPTTQLQITFRDAKHEHFDSQRDVYNLVASNSIESVFDSFNTCIMTYGQTGSGKTYTMMGKYDPRSVCGEDGEEGIVPRVCNEVFGNLEIRRKRELQKPDSERIRYRVEVTFVEIYMEKARDLLDPALRRGYSARMSDARIRHDPNSGPFVEGVTKYQVESWSQCCTLLERGSQHRTTCATVVHQQSSRSHAIFQLTILMEEVIPPRDRFSRPTLRFRSGRINLVDLAGSERGGMTDYVKESSMINKSLLALRRVIDNLVSRQNVVIDWAKQEVQGREVADRSAPQVPFRDSVLTWLLSDSIGGNARTTMVATLSPHEKYFADTLATLVWSSKARNLVTLVRMNDVQTTVTGGMTSKAMELPQQFTSQRQNIDSLRTALQQKQQHADALEKEVRLLARKISSVNFDARQHREQSAAILIQGAWAEYKINQKRKAVDDLRLKFIAQTEARKREHGVLMTRLTQMQTENAEVEEQNHLVRSEVTKLQSQVDAVRYSEKQFQARKAAVTQEFRALQAVMGSDATKCIDDIAALKSRLGELQREAAIVKGNLDKETIKRQEREAYVAQHSTDEFMTKVSNARRETEAAKQTILELQQERARLVGQREILSIQHEKVVKKKKVKPLPVEVRSGAPPPTARPAPMAGRVP